jgi:hypothetical protein
MAYAIPAQFKNYGGVSGADDDVLLEELLARAQSAIDHYCGRTFEASANATRKFTVGKDTEGRMLYLDEDLASIDAIVTNADAAVPTTLVSTEYATHPRNRTPYHTIELLSSSANSWTFTTNPESGVTVSGKWAWSVSAPDDIVHACIRLATYFYKQKDAGVFDITAIPEAGVIQVPQGIPRDVQLILNQYRKNF